MFSIEVVRAKKESSSQDKLFSKLRHQKKHSNDLQQNILVLFLSHDAGAIVMIIVPISLISRHISKFYIINALSLSNVGYCLSDLQKSSTSRKKLTLRFNKSGLEQAYFCRLVPVVFLSNFI